MDGKYAFIGDNAEQTNEQLELLWVSVGDADFLYEGATKFIEYLKAHDIDHKTLISGGGHTWMNTKKYLSETAQLLFK